MKIHRIDQVGIIVNDLAAAKAFFLGLGLVMVGEGDVEGGWAERIVSNGTERYGERSLLRVPLML